MIRTLTRLRKEEKMNEEKQKGQPMGIVENDTIAAISTALGPAGISIIRLSGPEAIAIGERLFKPFSGRAFQRDEDRKLRFGHILYRGEIIDEVLVSSFIGPNSYTGEDLVEINAHGGPVAVRRILTILLQEGARLADPGEFTKRAFLNGRIDLTQAEAVKDIIDAKTTRSQQAAEDQLSGKLSGKMKKLKDSFLVLLSRVEYTINFMEDALEDPPLSPTLEKGKAILEEMDQLLEGAETGRLLREGIGTVIVGKPNVGKSSLLNALLEDNRAIVTDIPGTTRDAIEESYQIDGLELRLIDTAGIRETDNLVEAMGVERSRDLLKKADLALLLFDGSRTLSKEDWSLLEEAGKMPRILLVNKSDLQREPSIDVFIQDWKKAHPSDPVIEISAKEGQGLEDLKEAIRALFFDSNREGEEIAITNVRHQRLLQEARDLLKNALDDMQRGIPLDACDVDLSLAYEKLAQITGEEIDEDILNKIFQDFCIGK